VPAGLILPTRRYFIATECWNKPVQEARHVREVVIGFKSARRKMAMGIGEAGKPISMLQTG
jgi:hypothetical protein